MKKQSLILTILACAISSQSFTMEQPAMVQYEPIPLDTAEIIIPSAIIASARARRQAKLLAYETFIADATTNITTLEATIRKQREQYQNWLNTRHNRLVEVLQKEEAQSLLL